MFPHPGPTEDGKGLGLLIPALHFTSEETGIYRDSLRDTHVPHLHGATCSLLPISDASIATQVSPLARTAGSKFSKGSTRSTLSTQPLRRTRSLLSSVGACRAAGLVPAGADSWG